ncbi:MAG: tRNA uridine-5-carboxymethylaminomethyl(34) synthesis enzyme MnmG [Bacteroidetes bacterium]|nr:tRNA uridine-5-carboxymethylaminomethyl(34) synthesis enzyme MnmG [Bacteroidota bacterium]
MFEQYDIIVVGAGHAGAEAAASAARLGSRVLLITMNLQQIAQMSCNPAMGGVAKGQIVREIDALGGYSGLVSDSTMIQFRMLNKSKGPAMWSPRTQNDRVQFSIEWRNILECIPNLDFWQDTVTSLIIKNNKVCGVVTKMGQKIYSQSVILTNGTFLNGKIHIGQKHFSGGRIGDPSSLGITERLVGLGFESLHLKTGTPVRVDGRTIDFSKMEEQKGDENPGGFSFLKKNRLKKQRSCWIAYTSSEVHDELRLGFSESPMFAGRIEGTGPRYCPSIEDKINRFSDKNRHQLFIEPEGWNTIEYYINGFSSSLPDKVQLSALRKIEGFEKAKIFVPGYAIEYDYFPPTQLRYTMETKLIENLYFAGQINGTTGYEEAAAQGLMAGINANLKLNNKQAFILKRHEAYIGVLIDDLVTKGVDEPYRMFTSRAEYRILLRQDNADLRLTHLGYKIGLATKERFDLALKKQSIITDIIDFSKKQSVTPKETQKLLKDRNTSPLRQKIKLSELLLRPQVNLSDLISISVPLKDKINNLSASPEDIEGAEILVKYDGYIKKEKDLVSKLSKLDNIPLKKDFDYNNLKSLSTEAREKLSKIKPETIGQASRISGVSPSDINVIAVFIGR